MARLAVINRELKRRKTVKKFEKRRLELLAIIADAFSHQNAALPEKEKASYEARLALQKLPRNASPVRLHNRCSLTGRGRGVYRKFGLGRNKLREFAFRGEIPGLTKASW